MAVTRPLKEGSVTTYQQKVAAGFPDILASEADADLDTIYAAWNGGVATANLIDGSVTFAKLAPDAQLWRDTGTSLTPGTNFAARPIVAVPGDAGGVTLLLGSTTAKGRLQMPVSIPGAIGLFSNRNWLSGNAQDDATKASWGLMVGNGDQSLVQRSPAGSTTQTTLLTLDSTGQLTLPTSGANNPLIVGPRTVKARLTTHPGVDRCWLTNNLRDVAAGNVQDDAAKPSWALMLATDADQAGLFRWPAGGAVTASFYIDASSNLIIAGATAIKASGTAWANPSDRRLKDDIEDYATGLAAIVQLQPRTFVFNGKGGSQAGMRGYGFIADEVAPVMPETVAVRAGKLDPDDEDETDIQTLDQSNLILALVNAVKELAARVDAR
jgi:hypothetical protein